MALITICFGVVDSYVLALFVMMCWRCLQVSEGGGRRNVRKALPLVAQKTRRFLQPRGEHQAESRRKSQGQVRREGQPCQFTLTH